MVNLKRQSDTLLKCALIPIMMAVYACSEAPSAQQPKTGNNPIAVQKVQPVPTVVTKIAVETDEDEQRLQGSVAPEKEGAAMTSFSGQANPNELPAAEAEQKSHSEAEASVTLTVNENTSEALKNANGAKNFDIATPIVAPELAVDLASDQVIRETGVSAEGSDLNKTARQVAGSYDPQDRFDPFEPLFKAQSAEQMAVSKSTREKRAPQTPLERVALSQLKVTAIIRSASGNRALVEDATGKGYVVQRGTYIGLNAGRVTEIDKGRIVVEEEIENIMGGMTLQNAELKLQKPAGEL